MPRSLFFIVAASLLASPCAAQVRERKEPRPAPLARLVGCRDIPDAAARLACFDREVGAFDEAERDRRLVVVDRGQIRKARRTLFGLNLPDFSLFGDDDEKGAPDEEGVTQLETTVAQASKGLDGRWMLVLADGARWVQADSRDLPRSPKAGMAVVIRKAAMGSFLANIDKQIAVRVRRIN